MSDNEWGFSNDADALETVRQWVAAAVADGWAISPTYQTESVDSAATLDKDGFQALVLTRDRGEGADGKRYRYEAKVSAWGPDRLAINVPRKYDFALMQQATKHCAECGKDGVDTQRVGFAGRVCADCLPKTQKQHEYPGWTS
jgi:hypothetical protein